MTVLDVLKFVGLYLDLYDDFKPYYNSVQTVQGESLDIQDGASGTENEAIAQEETYQESGESEEISEEVKLEFEKVLSAINIVVENICCESIPLKTQEEIVFDSNGCFDLSNLSKKINGVYAVYNPNKTKKYAYKILDEVLVCDCVGRAKIEYFYLPEKVESLSDKICVDTRVTGKAFVMGVVAEYCFINGLFDDASVWQERFEKAIKNCSKINKHLLLPRKRWL